MSRWRVRSRVLAGVVVGGVAAGLVAVATTLGSGSGPPIVAGQGPPAVTQAAVADEIRSPCAPGVVACVELSTQHVWLVRDGRVVRDGFISSGTTDMETPTGMFRVQYKSRNHVSGEYGTPMPYAVFFDTRGDALHEGSLAVQSRGCVHLVHDDAAAFYAALRPGDPVQILP